MKTVLMAVDDTKGSQAALKTFLDIFSGKPPKTMILLHVEQFGGKSVLHDRISDSDIAVLLEGLKGTDIQEKLDKKAREILDYYKKSLEGKGIAEIKTLVKAGHPAEEILRAAKEEGAEMIVIGSRGKRLHNLLLGSMSREVANMADVPVLIAR